MYIYLIIANLNRSSQNITQMSKLNFPIVSTKIIGVDKYFDISDPGQRQTYFKLKVGDEINQIKTFLEEHTFIALMLGKKGAGKGVYSNTLKEIFGEDKVGIISVGDITRQVFGEIKDPTKLVKLTEYLEINYRGYITVKETLDIFLNKTQGKLLPTEFILCLVSREIEKLPKKALIIDGFPRNVDQVSYSLYLRQIINFRNDPDLLVFIDVPESVIDARIKSRFVCPKCQLSRNLRLLPTSKINYDEKLKEYFLLCDRLGCDGGRMVKKEGDDQGIEPIRDRLSLDGKLMEMAQDIFGIPKIFLRNSIPIENQNLFDDYEITPEFFYERDSTGKIQIKTKPWVIKDDNGIDSISLMAPAVMISFIRQLAAILKPNF